MGDIYIYDLMRSLQVTKILMGGLVTSVGRKVAGLYYRGGISIVNAANGGEVDILPNQPCQQ
jgi:hypothetical protein